MYLNGERFSGGKNVLLPIAAVLFVLISFCYPVWLQAYPAQ